MKLRDYTYQSGNCVTHDTEIEIVSEDVYGKIRDMIRSGSGPLGPIEGITYQFTDAEDIACLSVEGENGPIWVAAIVPYQGVVERAVSDLDGIAERLTLNGFPVSGALPETLITPCIVTLLLPGYLSIDPWMMTLLGGVPRDFACVWLGDKFGM
jgi:hypothetical protein